MDRGQPPRGLLCPECGEGLEPLGTGGDEEHRLHLSRGATRSSAHSPRGERGPANGPAGRVDLSGAVLVILAGPGIEVARNGLPGGGRSAAPLVCWHGRVHPVVRGWLRDEIADWGGVVETLGGSSRRHRDRDPDADLGPVLARFDAPLIFMAVDEVSRRFGVKPPVRFG